MAKNNYMALEDVQKLWTEKIKPSTTGFVMLMPALSKSDYTTISIITNPEFVIVILDSENKIIAGLRNDNSYVGLPLDKAIQAIIGVISNI